MMKALLIGIALVSTCGIAQETKEASTKPKSALSDKAKPDDLATSIDSYQKDVQHLEEEYQTKIELVKTNYTKSLEAVLSKVQATGNLDKTLVLKAEIERFQATRTIPKSSTNNLLPEITTSQEKLRKDWVSLKQGKIIALGQRAVKQEEILAVLKQSLTKKGKLDEAIAVNTELDTIKKLQQAYKKELLAFKVTDTPPINSLDKGLAKNKPQKYPPEAEEYNGHHYMVYSDTSKWGDAKFKCTQRGGHLVVINDAKENSFVSKLREGCPFAWIGLSKSLNSWRWVTVDGGNYFNWESSNKAGKKVSSKIGVGINACIVGSGKWIVCDGDDADVTGYVCEWDE